MNDYNAQRAWSDKFIPAIQQIVGPLLLTPAPFELDTKQATDLIVLNARDMRIAARVRKPGYTRYGQEFTVRSKSQYGGTTELEKMVNGFGDWMFYGHSNSEETGFSLWSVINLNHWRASLIRDKSSIKMKKQQNRDGSQFCAFDIRSFPKHPPLLISSSDPVFFATEAAATECQPIAPIQTQSAQIVDPVMPAYRYQQDALFA